MHKILFVLFMAMPVCSNAGILYMTPTFQAYRGIERNSINVERSIEKVPIQFIERRALCFESVEELNKFLSVNKCDDCDLLDVEKNKLLHIKQVEKTAAVTVQVNDGYGWIAEPK